jgi:hypothetical protein
MGRKPIELDEARRARMLAALEAGATLRIAAAAAGVSESTLRRWRDRGGDDELQAAEARGALLALQAIRAAATGPHPGTWQAAAWLLERRYPAEYGRQAPAREGGAELDTVRGWLTESAARLKKMRARRLEGDGDAETDARLARLMGDVVARRGTDKPTGVIVLPAEDDAIGLPAPDLLQRAARTLRDDGLAFS